MGSGLYDVTGFKAGKSRLKPVEREELTGVQGKSLLHIQCHFGLDTLSWAREGAIVTGVDFSEPALEAARGLADECGIEARVHPFGCLFRAAETLRAVRHRLHLLRRSLLVARHAPLGRNRRTVPQTGWHLLHGRVPPDVRGLRR